MRFSAIFAFALFAISMAFSSGFVSLTSPSDGAQLTSLNTFTFSFADTSLSGGASVSCSLHIDGSTSAVASSSVPNYGSASFTYSAPSGAHTWQVKCGSFSSSNFAYSLTNGSGTTSGGNSTGGSVGNNSTGTPLVDPMADSGSVGSGSGTSFSQTPSVRIISPSNGTTFQYGGFSTTYAYAGPSSGTCTVSIDGAGVQTSTVASGSTGTYSSSSMAAGQHTVQVVCNYFPAGGLGESVMSSSVQFTMQGIGGTNDRVSGPSVILHSPIASSKVSSSTVPISFTYSGPAAATCTAYIDGKSSGSTDANSSFSGYLEAKNVANGQHTAKVVCAYIIGDNGATAISSQTIAFTVDTSGSFGQDSALAGEVSLLSPANGATLTSSSTQLSYVFSGSGTATCTIYLDGSPASTLSSPSGIVKYLGKSSLANGIHSWKVICSYTKGDVPVAVSSQTNTFMVNTVSPDQGMFTGSVSLISPLEGAKLTSSTARLVFSYYGPSPASCSAFIDGAKVGMETGSTSATTISASNIAQGQHNWRVVCSYTSGDSGPQTYASELRAFSYGEAKSGGFISLDFPTDGAAVSSSDVDFTYTYVHGTDSATASCTLSVDGKAMKSSPAIIEASNSERVTGIPSGEHTWNVTCLAGEKTISSATSRFTVPRVGAYVVLNMPADNAVLKTGDALLTFTFIPNGAGLSGNDIICKAYVNNKFVGQQPFDSAFPSSMAVPVKGLQPGEYLWTAKCFTPTEQEIASADKEFKFTVGMPNGPYVVADLPADETVLLDGNVQFAYHYVPNGGAPQAACTSYLDGTPFWSATAQGETSMSKHLAVTDGDHEWFVSCGGEDSASGSIRSQTNKFSVLTSGSPVVVLVAPAKNYRSATSPAEFTFKYLPASNVPGACSLYVDGVAVGTPLEDVLGIASISSTPFPARNDAYFWQIACGDDASEVRAFYVTPSGNNAGSGSSSGGSSSGTYGGSSGGSGTGGGSVSPRPITKSTVSKNITQTLPPKQNDTIVQKPPTVQYATIYAPAEAYVNSTVQIALLTSAGRPISSATVIVAKPDGSRDVITTDSRGRSSFTPMVAGAYSFSASGYTMTGTAQTIVREQPQAVQPKSDLLSQYGDYVLIFFGVVIVLAVAAGGYFMLTKKPEE